MLAELPTPTRTVKILLVDDHPAVREGLAMRISQEPDLTVCSEACSIKTALEALNEQHPDVAVIDISLKDGNGVELIKRITARDDSIRVLVCSMHDEVLYAERAIRAGAIGYITKEHATSQIVEAIRQVAEGKLYVSAEVAEMLTKRSPGKSGKASRMSGVQLLSDRELEVFVFLGQALDTNQIAERMAVSPKTVETYRSRIKEKLGIQTVAELIRRAVEWEFEKQQSGLLDEMERPTVAAVQPPLNAANDTAEVTTAEPADRPDQPA
jgi:DNA-binding NarL/FixJ family response regulator